jgi:hypothetical protein
VRAWGNEGRRASGRLVGTRDRLSYPVSARAIARRSSSSVPVAKGRPARRYQ